VTLASIWRWDGRPTKLAIPFEPIAVRPPGPGEALIRHTAIGLNFVEVYFRRGSTQSSFMQRREE
jgi:NADPH:quinone reductase-like Zn-dependent oxidoreductase